MPIHVPPASLSFNRTTYNLFDVPKSRELVVGLFMNNSSRFKHAMMRGKNFIGDVDFQNLQ